MFQIHVFYSTFPYVAHPWHALHSSRARLGQQHKLQQSQEQQEQQEQQQKNQQQQQCQQLLQQPHNQLAPVGPCSLCSFPPLLLPLELLPIIRLRKNQSHWGFSGRRGYWSFIGLRRQCCRRRVSVWHFVNNFDHNAFSLQRERQGGGKRGGKAVGACVWMWMNAWMSSASCNGTHCSNNSDGQRGQSVPSIGQGSGEGTRWRVSTDREGNSGAVKLLPEWNQTTNVTKLMNWNVPKICLDWLQLQPPHADDDNEDDDKDDDVAVAAMWARECVWKWSGVGCGKRNQSVAECVD